MAVQGNFINVEGAEEIFELLDNLDEFANYGTLGAVVSSGAFNRYGDRYERYVQSRDDQAWMHQGRWNNTVEDVAEDSAQDVAGIIETVTQMILDGASGAQFRPFARQALVFIQRKLRVYPAKPGGSRYDRTGELRNSWQIELLI